MAESNQNLKPLYGVYFNSSTIVDERDVKNDFSKYGTVFNVIQFSSRVFVNFFSKDVAEQLLQVGTHEKYGEIRKGRFGPKETRETDNQSTSSSKTPPRNSTKQFGKPTSYKPGSVDIDDTFENECAKHNDGYESMEDRRDNTQKRSPHNANSVLNNNIKKKSPGTDIKCKSPITLNYDSNLRECADSQHNVALKQLGNFSHENSHTPFSEADEIPNLVSVFHHARNPVEITYDDDSPPPLISTLSKSSISPKNYHNFHSRTACNAYENNLTLSNGSHQRNASTNSIDDIPPLISTEVHKPALKDFVDVCDDITQYSNHILIANVPDNTSVNEIEKVLYPLEPVYISDLDVTNVRFKIYFFHVLFHSEKEASTAVKQFDGLQLRGRDLTVKKLSDLLLLTQLSTVK